MEFRTTHNVTHILYSTSIGASCKTLFITMEENDNQLKSTCQSCNGLVKYSGRSAELLYITFLHVGFSTLELYPEELVPENFYFQWTS